MSFFKIITTPTPVAGDEKVGDTDFKSFYPAVNTNMQWCTLHPYVEQAEEMYIIPYISQEFYEEMETEYQLSGTIADEEKAKAFKYLRTALAYYTMYEAIPHLNARIADAGINENMNGDTAPVRQWVFNNSQWKACKKGYAFLDKALAYMEAQIQDGNTDFDTFKDSDAYTITRDLLIPTASIFNEYYNIQKSRKAYVALRPFIRKAEQLHLKPFLCELYQEISTQQYRS